MGRRWSILAAATVVVAGCAGSDEAPPASSAPVSETTTTTTDVPEPSTSTTAAPSPSTVELDVMVGEGSTSFRGTIDDSADPFGDFVSCSGVRAEFSTYSVAVSADDGDVVSVSVISTAPVERAGTFDALVRVEAGDGTAIDATGTMTLDPDFRTGTFQAFGTDGADVAGSFSCTPGDRTPAPLPAENADVDGVVEVFAQLRMGDAQRLIGFASSGAGDASVDCPGAGDRDAPLLVRASGDEALGAITEFDLTDEALRFVVGQSVYEFDAIERIGAGSSAAGSFSATSGPVSVTGAFRCT